MKHDGKAGMAVTEYGGTLFLGRVRVTDHGGIWLNMMKYYILVDWRSKTMVEHCHEVF